MKKDCHSWTRKINNKCKHGSLGIITLIFNGKKFISKIKCWLCEPHEPYGD